MPNNTATPQQSTKEALFFLKAAIVFILIGLIGFIGYSIAYKQQITKESQNKERQESNEPSNKKASSTDPKQAGLKHILGHLVTPYTQLTLDGSSIEMEVHTKEFIALNKAKKLRGSYSIEVLRAFDERTIISLLSLVENPRDYKYFRYEPGKKQEDFFVLLYGKYADKLAADVALAELKDTLIKYRENGYQPKAVLIDSYFPYISNRSGDADLVDHSRKKTRNIILTQSHERPFVPPAVSASSHSPQWANNPSTGSSPVAALQDIDSAFEHTVTPKEVKELTDPPTSKEPENGTIITPVPVEIFRQ